MNYSDKNKQIAKNTLYLYIRTFITLILSLYTSRVLLQVLGVTDLGIYNVVGGVVTMLSFLNTSMAAGTQRFLSFELANQNKNELNHLFSMLLFIHILVAIIILILSESVGLWFLKTKLVIPQERLSAAMWVFQFSILSAIVTITQVPYNASIIAHEKMDIFALISVSQTFAKLIVIYLLLLFDFDKLKLISILNFIIILSISLVYRTYCKRNFQECHIKYQGDILLFKRLIGYSSWNILASISNIIADQGINMLLNVFFGPAINASRTIALQIKSAISSFVSNFQLAANPQITKSYASGDIIYMGNLIKSSAKFSAFLLMLFAFPVILEAEYIIGLWLRIVPDYSVIFCRLVLINACIDCLSSPLITAVQATGKIKTYQMIVCCIIMFNFPLSYFLLNSTHSPEIVFYVSIFISLVLVFTRVLLFERFVKMELLRYFGTTIAYILFVLIPPSIVSYFIFHYIDYGFYRFITNILTSFVSILISIYFLGLSRNERTLIYNYVVNKLFKKKEKESK